MKLKNSSTSNGGCKLLEFLKFKTKKFKNLAIIHIHLPLSQYEDG